MFKFLFSDDQITVSNTEENTQEAAYKFNQKITELGVTISAQKTKLVAFNDGIWLEVKL
jgi:cell division protein FtsL